MSVVRLRMEVTAVIEYDVYPSDYDTDDPAEMARVDQVTAEEDVFWFIDSTRTKWTIKASVVDPDQVSS